MLVLGGTRFIGPPTVRCLAAMGHAVAVFHRGLSEPPLPQEVRHLHGDRKDLASFLGDFKAFRPDVVLDLNAHTEQAGRRLVALFRGVARRLVVISSADVYRAYDRFRRADPGPPDPVPMTEDAPLREKLFPYRDMAKSDQDFAYHYDKILMERAVASAPDLPATVLRLPMVYGPGDLQHRLLDYLKRMDDGRPAILLSEGYARWRGLRGYVEDMGHAAALCAARDRAAGRIYHVAEAGSATEAEWAARIARAAGWSGRILPLPDARLPAHLACPYDTAQDWTLDSSRIRAELGYAEQVPADEAMRRTVEWERANPPPQVDPARFDYAAEDPLISACSEDPPGNPRG